MQAAALDEISKYVNAHLLLSPLTPYLANFYFMLKCKPKELLTNYFTDSPTSNIYTNLRSLLFCCKDTMLGDLSHIPLGYITLSEFLYDVLTDGSQPFLEKTSVGLRFEGRIESGSVTEDINNVVYKFVFDIMSGEEIVSMHIITILVCGTPKQYYVFNYDTFVTPNNHYTVYLFKGNFKDIYHVISTFNDYSSSYYCGWTYKERYHYINAYDPITSDIIKDITKLFIDYYDTETYDYDVTFNNIYRYLQNVYPPNLNCVKPFYS